MWRRLPNSRQARFETVPPGLAPESEFLNALACERSRADRAGSCFALLVIEIRTPREGVDLYTSLRVLAAVLGQRTRLQDVWGLYKGRVGVILTDAAPAGVTSVWEDIEHRFRLRIRKETGQDIPIPSLFCEVFHYPGDGLSMLGAPESRVQELHPATSQDRQQA